MKLKFRRGLIQFLAFLLVALPALGVFASPSSAATSRVAVIQSLNGTVQVKKSGGSKEFRAFARMSLNEGDVLTTSANSSAVLQFANGSSEDDKMTVSANTTLTFSKLSDRNGTRTKVSMFNGNAWVDVKSIATNNDEFTLETPTAIMGVRGTHLMVSVDPLTGETRLTVAAGVVNTKPTGTGESRDVLPGDHALVTKDEEDNGEVYIAPVDLDALMKLSPADLIEAILNAASEVAQENEQKMNEYLNQTNAPGSASPADLDRIRNNIESLLGAIVQSAMDSGKITQDRVREIVSNAESRTGFKVDLTKKDIRLSEVEKRKQEILDQQAERNRERAEQQKQLEEQKRKQQEELLKKLEEEKKKKEEELRKALEEKRKQAEAAYEKSLSDAELKRYQDAKKQREQERTGQTPSSNTPPTDPGSSQPDPVNAFLSYVKVQPVNSQEADTVQMTSGKFQYSLQDVTGSVPGLAFTPIAQNGAIVKQVKVNGETVTGNVQSDLTVVYLISLSEGDNSIETIVQEASNANRTNSYTFKIKWTYVEPSVDIYALDSDGEPVDFPAEGSFSIPYELNRIQLYVETTGIYMGVSVFVDGAQPDFVEEGGYFDLHLDGTVHQIEIRIGDEVYASFTIDRSSIVTDPDRNALLNSMGVYYWLVEGWVDALGGQNLNAEFNPLQTYYEIIVPPLPSMESEGIIISAEAVNPDAEIEVWNGSDEAIHVANNWVEGYSVPFHDGENNILITVTNGPTTQHYRVLIHTMPVDRPYLVTNWSATAMNDEGLEEDVVWMTETERPFEFVTRVSSAATALQLELEFDDTRYFVAALNCFSESCDSIDKWTNSGDKVDLELSDGNGVFILGVFDKDDDSMVEALGGAMLFVTSTDPELDLWLNSADESSYGAVKVDEFTYLAQVPQNKEFVCFDPYVAEGTGYEIAAVTVDGEVVERNPNYCAYEIALEDEVTEVEIQIVDQLGFAASPVVYTLKIYTGSTVNLQFDADHMSLTDGVYSAVFGFDESTNEYSAYLQEDWPVEQGSAQLNLPLDEHSRDASVFVYDSYGRLVDPDDITIESIWFEYYLLILSNDAQSWNVVRLVIQKNFYED